VCFSLSRADGTQFNLSVLSKINKIKSNKIKKQLHIKILTTKLFTACCSQPSAEGVAGQVLDCQKADGVVRNPTPE